MRKFTLPTRVVAGLTGTMGLATIAMTVFPTDVQAQGKEIGGKTVVVSGIPGCDCRTAATECGCIVGS